MRTIFLADAHLTAPDTPNYRALLQFLSELRGTAGTLFIMGDLFDFWVGFPSNPFRQFDPVIEALEALKRSGCRLVYFEGNHDFHLGPVFRDRLRAEIYPGPAEMTVDGIRLYLCHGDQINPADIGYRLLRLLLHNPLVAAAVRVFPPRLALAIKERLQQQSRATYYAKSSRWDYPAIIRNFAEHIHRHGCSGFVCGHFHLAYREEPEPGFTILSLGDWIDQFTYGELEEGRLHLKRFIPHPEH